MDTRASSADTAPHVQFEKITLDNGLQVILHLDRKLPVAHVNQWFHVGSKNEKPGRTGFAHLFEHLMYEGSKHTPDGYFPYIQRAGANTREGGVNGTTSHDRTNYFATVPSGNLEYVLWLESDRVATLAEALTPENFDNQRDVVRNERRQIMDNQPYGRWQQLVAEQLYPAGHPYGWPVIGSHEDLEAATIDDVRTFFQTYYTPNNLSLVIAGDFDPDGAMRLVETYYGGIAPGPPLSRPVQWIPKLHGEKVVEVQDRVPQARLFFVWPAPARFDEDEAKLDIASTILWDGLSSRLKKLLVYEQQICTDVMAFDMSMEIAGMFIIIASIRPGSSIKDVEDMITREIAHLATDGPTADEMQRAQNTWAYKFVTGLERIGGFGGKADRLNESNVYTGNPGYFLHEFERFTGLTDEDVRTAAHQWLDTRDRLIIRFYPEAPLRVSTVSLDRSRIPAFGADTRFHVPGVAMETLDNGLEVFVVARPELPKVSVTLAARAGSVYDPVDRSGTSHLMMMTIDKGTQTRTAIEIAEALGSLGVSLQGGAYHESSEIAFEALRHQLDPAMGIMADIVRNPLFSESDIDREIKRHLDVISQHQSHPQGLSGRIGPMLAFGLDHPYGLPVHGFSSSAQQVSRMDVVRSHDLHWNPQHAALIMVGDITLEAALELVHRRFGDWSGETVPVASLPEPQPMGPGNLYIVDRPDAPQTLVCQLLPAPARTTPEYYALRLADAIWGGGFGSRLNRNLREEKGYTYGISSRLVLYATAGIWWAQSAVETDKTGDTVRELMAELRGMAGEKPVTDTELAEARTNRVHGYAQQFETLRRIGGQVAALWSARLPMSEMEHAVEEMERTTLESVNTVAQRYARPEQASILLIGDRARIETQVQNKGWGEVIVLDEEGNRVDE